jgi:calcyclin binding protein
MMELISLVGKCLSRALPKMDEGKDPGDSLMQMMKNMYETGDDEMKRTIAKAWTESREKMNTGGGDDAGMPGF